MEHKEEPLLVSDDALVEMTLRNSLITREQVRGNEELQPLYNARYLGGHDVRAIYEQSRAKDRALIQALRAERDDLLRQRDEALERVAQLETECMQMAHTITTWDNPDPDAHIADQEEYLAAKQKRVKDSGSWTEQDTKDFEDGR